MGVNLNPEEMFEVFGADDPTQYAAEAEQRWGETDSYKESQRRVSKYTQADWAAVQAEGQQVVDAFIAARHAGLPADSVEAMAAAELHRLQINDRFYPCSHEFHINLAEMYLADPRFLDYYNKFEDGLGQYVVDAIFANAVAHA